jgi:serine/threonine protein kinase
VHRDIKLANILIHFPEYPKLLGLGRSQKMKFLKDIDLMNTKFEIKIADFGLAKRVG